VLVLQSAMLNAVVIVLSVDLASVTPNVQLVGVCCRRSLVGVRFSFVTFF
jgi:hypothetical protein